jgi:hypothetical protein
MNSGPSDVGDEATPAERNAEAAETAAAAVNGIAKALGLSGEPWEQVCPEDPLRLIVDCLHLGLSKRQDPHTLLRLAKEHYTREAEAEAQQASAPDQAAIVCRCCGNVPGGEVLRHWFEACQDCRAAGRDRR